MANSFLQGLEHGGGDILSAALSALGPAIVAAISGAAGGGPASVIVPVATSLVTGIVNAEKAHVATQKAQAAIVAQANPQINPEIIAPVQPGISGSDKKAMVLSNLQFALPLIEALAAQAGFPIADPVAFQIALGPVVDATVAAINAYSVLIAAIKPKTA